MIRRFDGACPGCGTFAPEVSVSVGRETVEVCHLCAHDLTAHARPLGLGLDGRDLSCECTVDQVYPADVLTRRAEAAAAARPPV